MEPPLDPANAEDATRRPRDPDVWAPDPIDPGRTVANATAIENELRWMDNVRSFNWLTRPVVAPLPDLQGLGWSAGSGTRTDRMASVPDAEDALPTAAFPELVMRKPTAFNCQTVIDDRLSRDMPSSVLPYTGDSKDFGAGAPIPAYRRFLYAKYADFIPQVDSGGVLKERVDGTTRFLYPPWARPAGRAGQFAATSADSYTLRSDPIQVDLDGNGTLDDVHYGMDLYPERSTGRLSIYRVYMGDKGGRLVDHQGRNLVIDLVTMRPALHDGDIISGLRNQANGSTDDAGYPLAEMQRRLGLGQWRMQGVWNTLDRIPHGESLQMLHKDDDFEQLGELADVFLWGPAYRVYRNPQTSVTASAAEWSPYNPDGTLNGRLARGGWLRPTDLQTTTDYNATSVGTGIAYDPVAGGSQPAAQLIPPRLVSQCRATFAEIMTGRVPGFPVGEGPMVNRLQVDPPNIAFHQPATGDPYATATGWGAPQQYGGTSALAMPYAPNVPWGMRVFDAFTLDGPGGVLRYDWSDQFAGRTIDMNPSSSPSPGSITATTGAAGTNVLPFETATGAPGNPFFNPSVQDGAPSTTGLTHRMTAARPAGALIPLDAYRDARVVDNVGRVAPSVTRASLAQWEHDRTPSLSGGFRGLPVPGLLNVNTATVEALRSLPHLNQMVYDDSGRYRIGGSPQFELHGTARESPYSLGLAGTLPAASGISSLNTDGQFRSLAANLGDRGPNPTSKLPEAMSIYRDGLNPNTLLAASTAAATVTDWYVREFTDPMKPAAGGSAARPDSTATVSVPSSFPIYPSYVDRGEAAGTPALVGTGLTATGVDETGSRRDPFHFVHYNRGMRATPGFGTIGEIMGLGRTTRTKLNGDGSPTVLPAVPGFALFPDWQYDQSWSVRLAGLDPYRSKRFDPTSGQGWQSYVADPDGQSTPDPLDARLSTDRQSVRTFDFSTADRRNNVSDAVGADGLRDLTVNDAFRVEPDAVAGDSEERNLLFKGVSNLVSTRSDVFTAYFRVKTVKQGPDGRWNAMDPETLLSEGRYVMCIDRSKVNRPTDKPRIVYFTKVQD
jgi:hypothetical protein